MDRWWYIAPLLIGLFGCAKPHPPNPPTPPPEPGIEFADMLLRSCGTGQFCVNGQPLDFSGCEACCKAHEGGNPGWPMFSPLWVDFCQTHRANFFHARPGPFLVVDEPDMAEFGGPYEEVGDKADLTRFNVKFWNRFADIVRYAGERGAWVEVDLIDSWRLKGDCEYSAWNRSRNIQGEDHCISSHRGMGDVVHDAWLRQVVKTVGRFGNVIWQIGNESGSVAGKNAGLVAWERWVRNQVRQHEGVVGFGVVHMVGTCSEFDEIENAGWVDYINRHGEVPTAPAFGKPTANNEINPAPPPDAYLSLFCQARGNGAYFWAWRSELSQPDWERVLSSISQARLNNCQGVDTSPCPYPVRPTAMLRCKPFGQHGGYPLYDCTPQTAGGQPIWPEGDGALRSACEAKSMGGLPDYSIQSPLQIHHVTHGGLAFAVSGSGSSPVSCSIPKEPAGYRGCVDTAGSPLVVTQ